MLALLASTVGAYLLRLTAFRRSHYAAFRLEVILRTRLSEHLARLSLGQIQGPGPRRRAVALVREGFQSSRRSLILAALPRRLRR